MPHESASADALLRLALVPGIGPRRLDQLLRRFGSAERVLGASAEEIAALPRFPSPLAVEVAAAAGAEGGERAERAREALARAGAGIVVRDDDAFPDALLVLPDAPHLLFVAGDPEAARRPGIAVVGTREPTLYGRRTTAELAGDLTRAGWTVVSGMAKGIDAAAHAGALDAGGTTVGVLGHGIDVVYPAGNRALFERVRAEGLLLTELPPGEEPRAGNFPRRNRLIAALAEGVVVPEMSRRSGAQHTVAFALELGREIFAVPGPVGSGVSEGTNQLLKDGARLVTSAADVVEELRGVGADRAELAPARTAARTVEALRARHAPAGSTSTETVGAMEDDAAPGVDTSVPPADLEPDQARLLAALGAEPRHVDEAAAEAGLDAAAAAAALLGLELRGLAAALPGKRYVRGAG